MKKIILMVVAAMMASVNANAQHEEGDITIQPRVGITLSNLTNYEDGKMKLDLTYGVEIEHYLTDQLGLAAGLLYTNQGVKDTIDDGTACKLDNHYIAVPITVNYYVLPGLALKAGVQPAFRVKTKLKADGKSYDVDKAIDLLFDNDDFKFNKFDLSIPVGFSYEYGGLTLDARYNFGLTKVVSGAAKSIRNQVIVVTLGYKL